MDKIYRDSKFLLFSYNRNKIPYEIPARRIPYIDLTFLISGEMRYACNGEYIELKPGDAIILPQGSERRRFKVDREATYASFNVQLPESFEIPVYGRVEGALRPDIMVLIDRVERDRQVVSMHDSGKCLSIFFYLLYDVIETAMNTENHHIKRLKQYVHDHLSCHMTLGEIADAVHLVPGYVCTLFKKSTGMTVTEYILRTRISMAKRLIVAGEMNLSEISDACGFDDYNYFSRSFKRLVGVTPSSYKNSNRINQ